ncbi:hypothetical protein GCM10023335_54600 [Streptomyces siamensis]|uniref:Transposase n=1 Tax=Streptomyces siamensis TaxID=1274986 RepID=A0ABP9J8U8_9ACTN
MPHPAKLWPSATPPDPGSGRHAARQAKPDNARDGAATAGSPREAVSWLAGCRCLHRRYERKAEHFLAFAGTAAALIGSRRLRS